MSTKAKEMGFGSWIGGILLCVFAVILAFFGIAVLLDFVQLVPKDLDILLGAATLIVALILFLYGWYSYQSAKPKGTINVHNV